MEVKVTDAEGGNSEVVALGGGVPDAIRGILGLAGRKEKGEEEKEELKHEDQILTNAVWESSSVASAQASQRSKTMVWTSEMAQT